MKKITSVLLNIFAVGTLLALFAGALAFLGYIVALFVGGAVAEELCAFIYTKYFPVIIQICSICVAFGLVGMYLSKTKALAISASDADKTNNTT